MPRVRRSFERGRQILKSRDHRRLFADKSRRRSDRAWRRPTAARLRPGFSEPPRAIPSEWGEGLESIAPSSHAHAGSTELRSQSRTASAAATCRQFRTFGLAAFEPGFVSPSAARPQHVSSFNFSDHSHASASDEGTQTDTSKPFELGA